MRSHQSCLSGILHNQCLPEQDPHCGLRTLPAESKSLHIPMVNNNFYLFTIVAAYLPPGTTASRLKVKYMHRRGWFFLNLKHLAGGALLVDSGIYQSYT